MTSVRLEGVSKRFGRVAAVTGLSLEVMAGEMVVLLGPTGAGKTTTLRLVAGLERPDEGRVHMGGRDVTALLPAARDVAFVFQQYSLYPHLSVYDNLAFPLRAPARRVGEAEIAARIGEVAALLRIDQKLKNRVTRLSGGEMQRVAIGRALVRRPALYLMDEPLSSLDAKLRSELRLELKRIKERSGATILYVTHDQIEAMTLASRLGVIDRGRLVQVGTPRDIYERPRNIYVAERLGSPAINLIPASRLPHPGTPAAAVTIGARTEHIRLRPADGADRTITDGTSAGGTIAGGTIAGVRRVEHLGDQSHVHLETDGLHLVTLADPHDPVKPGDRVRLELVNPLFFDAAGERIEP